VLENQTQPKPAQKGSKIKWAALAIGGSCALVACAVLVLVLAERFFGPQIGGIISQIQIGLNGTAVPTQVEIISPTDRPHPEANANTMGDPKAPVKITEYADFQCPFCVKYWQETEPQIITTYVATGKVFYEYRSVGAFIGSDSASAAEAAYCAGDQGKFWEYHDLLFSNWTGENVGDFSSDKLSQYAAAAGLDANKFDDCLSRGVHAGQIEQDVTDAKADGIRATPSFLINGKLVEGAQPFDVFQQTIESALKGN
jgi:protein-disulfide isomerase